MANLETNTYTQLRSRIQTALSEGLIRAQRAVERERVIAYWNVGNLLVDYLERNPADYGGQVLERLSSDVGLSLRTLYSIIRFRRCFPTLKTFSNLLWSHYVAALSVPDERVQGRPLVDAEKHRWTVGELRKQIAAASDKPKTKPKKPSTAPLAAKRGEPHLYRLIEKPRIGLVLDQGFRTYTVSTASLPKSAKPGDVFRSVKTGSRYTLEPYQKVRRVWSYVAHVNEVTDGDTVWVTLNTGFGDYVDQKLRLRGIHTGTEHGSSEAGEGFRGTGDRSKQTDHCGNDQGGQVRPLPCRRAI